MAEKRKFIRLQSPIGIAYKLIRKHKRQRSNTSFIKDISGGGFSFAPKEDLRNGDLLDVEIQIPQLSKPVRAVAEVVWFARRARAGQDTPEAGVYFRDIKPADLCKILEYIYAVGIGAR